VIRYASRRDAAVFSYYRWFLATHYEDKLARAGLGGSVLAYRRLPAPAGGGKSNIHFAHETFEAIRGFDSCVVVALDISQFFESLDHARLEHVWAGLLGRTSLPPDHQHVFRNITRYADVDRDEAYVRYGHARWEVTATGRRLKITSKRIPVQLGSMEDFRRKIAGKGCSWPKLIERHTDPHGIPQGAPLSDLLANLYLFDFDIDIQDYVLARGGVYFRYSDDILIVLPGSQTTEADAAEVFARDRISAYGPALQIKAAKTSAYVYWRAGGAHRYRHLKGKAPHGLEYLGFRFDGLYAHIRPSTLSRLHRNMTLGARAAARAHVARYPGKPLAELLEKFNIADFMQKFGRVRDFSQASDPQDWTFWTYVCRAKKIFGPMGRPLDRQLSRYRAFVWRSIEAEIARAYRDQAKP